MEINRLRILVIDDDLHILEQIEKFLINIPYIEPISFLQDGLKVTSFVDRLDIVILDINMPTVNGMELANYFNRNYPNVKIIFMSAFSEYAIQAYEFYPLDFLTKPISFLRLEQTLRNLSKEINQDDKLVKIGIKVNSSMKFIPVDEIVFVERMQRKTKIVLDDGTEIETNESLTDIEKKLRRNGFYRSHQSYLIPLNKIEEISPDDYMSSYNIKIKKSTELIKVSKHKYRALKDALKSYINLV